jgi:hypothetical protein
MIRTKIIPEEIKEGLLTPILKKNKPVVGWKCYFWSPGTVEFLPNLEKGRTFL